LKIKGVKSSKSKEKVVSDENSIGTRIYAQATEKKLINFLEPSQSSTPILDPFQTFQTQTSALNPSSDLKKLQNLIPSK